MTADKLTPVVPNLRFPEFRSAGDWLFQPLSDIAEPISERVGTSKCVPMSVTTGVGLLSQEKKFGRTIAGNSYRNYVRLQTNDFAYNKSATKEFPQGYIARYSGTRDAAVPNSIFTCFRPDAAAVIPEYLDHLLHGNHHGRWLRKYITVGARAHGALSVSDDALMSMPVPLPPVAVSRPEQQKIADCLGSLDDLIAAEGRKLEALRQHKQGLMQQLFPQPGETVPRLRFPEFQDAPDWKTGRCRDIAKVLPGYGFPDKFQGNKKGHYPFYKVSDISNTIEKGQKYISEANNYIDSDVLDNIRGKSVPAGTIIFAKIGEAIRSNRRVITTMPAVIDNNTAGLKAMKAKSSDEFLFYLWSNVSLIDHAGGVVPAVNKSALENVPLCYPSDPAEQQRIADCLSALSTRIGAQMSKLDTLRTHKQGFMQQLFPSLEGH